MHNRKSIRLKGFDYGSEGAYFITICVQNRECIYGHIKDGVFAANEAGMMVDQYWRQIEQEFENIRLDEYVVMPNHLHGIICIGAHEAGADTRPGADTMVGIGTRHGADTRPAPTATATIGDIICAFKSRTTNCYIQNVREKNWKPFNKRLWQRNYYEHIIRNEDEMGKVRNYINNNPLEWELDVNNSTKQSM
jgi:REP element-mobilizing transposase RayT